MKAMPMRGQRTATHKAKTKTEKVMKEYSGNSGPVVKNSKQTIAIALSEAGKSKPKKK